MHGMHYDARDEVVPAAFGLASSSAAAAPADFSPPRHTSLHTASSLDNDDQDRYKDMSDLPSVPPTSSVHVAFAPPVASAAMHGGDYEYMYDGSDGFDYMYSSYRYPYQQESTYEAAAKQLHEHQCHINDSDVTDRDVKFGRGGGTNRHPGNLFFRKLVSQARPAYLTAKKTEKGHISRQIVGTIRSNGGRWLKMDSRRGTWEDVGDDEAAKKVSQALREGLALKRRQALMASVSGKSSVAYPSYRGSPDEGKCRARRSGKRAKVQE